MSSRSVVLQQDELEKFCREASFSHRYSISGNDSIVGQFSDSQERCGIYLLEFKDGTYYIGQSVDVARRFREHQRNFDDIVGFRFRPTIAEELDSSEIHLIHQSESIGMVLRNIEHAAVITGNSKLDSILPTDVQSAWLAKGKLPDEYSRRTISTDESHAQRIRMERKYETIQQNPLYATARRLLASYIQKTIIAPGLTEYSYWSLSCLPSTNSGTWPRLICVNIRDMETFVLGYMINNPERIWGFINATRDDFHRGTGRLRFHFTNPFVRIRRGAYQSPGFNQVQIEFTGAKAADRLLSDDAVYTSARSLNLHLMRKGRTLFSRYHCFPLADEVIDT